MRLRLLTGYHPIYVWFNFKEWNRNGIAIDPVFADQLCGFYLYLYIYVQFYRNWQRDSFILFYAQNVDAICNKLTVLHIDIRMYLAAKTDYKGRDHSHLYSNKQEMSLFVLSTAI